MYKPTQRLYSFEIKKENKTQKLNIYANTQGEAIAKLYAIMPNIQTIHFLGETNDQEFESNFYGDNSYRTC
jgi:hypothetical protein